MEIIIMLALVGRVWTDGGHLYAAKVPFGSGWLKQ